MSAIILQGYVATSDNRIVVCGYEFNGDAPPDPPASPPAVYNVTIASASNGSTSLEAGTYPKDAGTQLSITATADEGYMFLYWTDGSGVNEENSTYTLTVAADITLTPVYHELTGPTGEYAGTMANLWTNMLAKIHAQGVNTNVTIHNMSLGEPDDTTGIPKKFYTDVPSDVIINAKGIDFRQLSSGNYAGLKAKGYSYSRVLDGDQITDYFGNVWNVESSMPYHIGDLLQYYELDLSLSSALSSGNDHPIAYEEFRFRIKVIDADTFENDHFPYVFPFMLS